MLCFISLQLFSVRCVIWLRHGHFPEQRLTLTKRYMCHIIIIIIIIIQRFSLWKMCVRPSQTRGTTLTLFVVAEKCKHHLMFASSDLKLHLCIYLLICKRKLCICARVSSPVCDVACVCLSPGNSSGDGCLYWCRYLSRFARCWFQEEGFCLHPVGAYNATSFPVHVSEGQHACRAPQGEPISHAWSFCTVVWHGIKDTLHITFILSGASPILMALWPQVIQPIYQYYHL